MNDRVDFQVRDAADPELADRYDLVTVFEAVHDMAKPVEALRAIRGLLADGGVALVADERVADEFTAPGDDVERVMYGWSILHCLPVGRVEQPSAETGTAMRESTFRRYAEEAGSGRSRSCRSSTTSGASTAWRLRSRVRGREREAPSPQPTRAPVPSGSSSHVRSEPHESRRASRS